MSSLDRKLLKKAIEKIESNISLKTGAQHICEILIYFALIADRPFLI